MEIHEMETELHDIADVIVSDLASKSQEKHTDLPDEAAQGSARLDLALSVLFREPEDAALSVRIRSLVMDRLAKEDVGWAISYHSVVTQSLYRPAYDSALAAGVDPAVVIAANCKIPLKEARAVARRMKKDDAAKEDATKDGAIPGEVPQENVSRENDMGNTSESPFGENSE